MIVGSQIVKRLLRLICFLMSIAIIFYSFAFGGEKVTFLSHGPGGDSTGDDGRNQ